MKSKEVSLTKIENIKNTITNVKSCAFRGDRKGFETFMDKLEAQLQDLHDLISSEQETFLTRPYQGL